MGAQYDAPNQQVVRADGSGPWDEGSGGSTPQSRKGKAKDDDGEAKQDKQEKTRRKDED